MGYVYKSRPAPLDDLSLIHKQIARGLGLDLSLVKKTLPEERLAEAQDILNDIDIMDAHMPSLWTGAPALNAIVALALMPGIESDMNRLLVGSLAVALCTTTYLYIKRDGDAKIEGARHDVLKKFFELATREEKEQIPPIKRDKPFWRDEKPASPDVDPV